MSREAMTFTVQVSNEGVRFMPVNAAVLEHWGVFLLLSFLVSYFRAMRKQALGGDAVVMAFVKGLASLSTSSNFGVPPSQRLVGFERVFLQPGQV